MTLNLENHWVISQNIEMFYLSLHCFWWVVLNIRLLHLSRASLQSSTFFFLKALARHFFFNWIIDLSEVTGLVGVLVASVVGDLAHFWQSECLFLYFSFLHFLQSVFFFSHFLHIAGLFSAILGFSHFLYLSSVRFFLPFFCLFELDLALLFHPSGFKAFFLPGWV